MRPETGGIDERELNLVVPRERLASVSPHNSVEYIYTWTFAIQASHFFQLLLSEPVLAVLVGPTPQPRLVLA